MISYVQSVLYQSKERQLEGNEFPGHWQNTAVNKWTVNNTVLKWAVVNNCDSEQCGSAVCFRKGNTPSRDAAMEL